MLFCTLFLVGLVLLAIAISLASSYFHKIPHPPEVLKGKSILITGCDTGFGNLTARRLDSEGQFTIFAGCLTQKGIESLKAGSSQNLIPFLLDVTNGDSIQSAAEMISKKSPEGLWGIINNAGLLRGGLLETTPYEDWKLTFEVNVFGMAMITKALIPHLRKIKGSRVVNISSVAGRTATAGTSAYSASKFAVQALSDALRRELAVWGIHVVIIQPGIMKTPLYDQPFEKTVDAIYDSYSEAAKEAYGRDFAAKSFESAKKLVEKVNGDPNQVVEALTVSVKAKSPPHRLSVGKDTPVWIGLSFLPSGVGDFILSALAKAPVPAALAKH
eukprot:TRINITY_DN14856_c0_g1_i1.p1 TRINITY_DN14856_c0_g1~~TRINITY_DN14856_c0_g1_i1.p1  ORF type:complete len:329 (-),score=76.69 TRINITY_DN14856_c0_g1_i1:113-1099(-)